MGREIVYCEACGTNLREADFEKGKACKVDNRPYCTACAPVQPAAPVATRPGATPRGAARKVSSTSVPAQPGTPRRSMPTVAKGLNPMVLAACVAGGLVILILLVVAASSGRPKPPPPPPPAPKTSARPEPAAAPPTEPRAAEEPAPRRPVVLQREPETLKEPTEQEKSAKLDAFLAQIRTMIAADKEFERRAEIVGMIAAAEKSAGSRLADVRALRDLYEKSFEAAGKARPADADPWKPWKIESSNEGGCPKFHASLSGRENVLETHPLTREKPASLEREVDLPAGKKSMLSLWVAPHAKGDWELRVFADGKLLHKQAVSPAKSGWKAVSVDLTPLAGKKMLLRLENAATEWLWEYGYWSGIEIRSE